MSRSHQAWTKSCAWIGAVLRVIVRLGTHGPQARRGHGRVTHTSSSLSLFTRVVTGMMLVLALSPAIALGKASSSHHEASAASATRGAAQARPTSPSTSRNSDPHHAGGDPANAQSSRSEFLARGAGYATKNGSSAVKALQRRLLSLGYSPGPIDGRYGPLTESAVIRFQATHGLRVDGIAGPVTLAALASVQPVLYPGEGYSGGGSQPVRDLQRKLAAAGYQPGPIDGRYGPLTEHAVMRYQAARHLRVDGIAGPQTFGQLRGIAPRVHTQTQRRSGTPRTTHPTRHPNGATRPTRHPNGATRPTRHPNGAAHPARHPNGATRPSRHPNGAASPAPRPNSAPAGTAKPARPHQKTGSIGTLPLIAIIVVACALIALFAAALWQRRGRPVDGLPVVRRRRQMPQFRRGIRARRDMPDGGLTPLNLRERAAEQLHEPPEPAGDDLPKGAAAFRLGLLLAQDGDLVRAEDAFRRADEHEHPDAAFELGVLLIQEGDRNGAKAAFRRADERGHSEAPFTLGGLLAEEGDREGAKEAFRRAVERNHPDAAFNLGSLLLQERDVAGAEDAFRTGDQRGDPGAACNLGVLLEQRGDTAGAKEAYRRADERGHAVGACNLGALLEYEGDVAGAKDAYRRADGRGDPIGSYNLGLLLEREGDRDGAKEAYRRADQRGNAEAACSLGFLLKQEGDRDGALQAFKRAGEQGSREVAEVAHAEMVALGASVEGEQ